MKAGLAVIVVNGQETLNMIKYRGDQMKRILSIIISANISTKITMAKICDTIFVPLFYDNKNIIVI